MAEQRHQTAKRRLRTAIWAAVVYFIVLNVDQLVEDRGWNQLIVRASEAVWWGRLVNAVQEFFWIMIGYAAGLFGLGFVCGALFIALLDWIVWLVRWIGRALGITHRDPTGAVVDTRTAPLGDEDAMGEKFSPLHQRAVHLNFGNLPE